MISILGLTFALTAAFFFTAYGLLSRVLAVKSESPVAFAALYGLFATLFSVPVIWLYPGGFRDVTYGVIFATFLATAFYGAQEATQFFMRKYLEASRSTIFYQLTPVITFITSLLLIGESISAGKIWGVILIVGGNLIAVYKHSGHITRRGLLFALVTVIALGFAYVADKVASPHYPLGVYLVISYFFPAIYVIPFIQGKRLNSLRREISLARWRLPLLSLVSVVGYFFVLKTLRLAEVSAAIPLIYTSTIFTALGGILILRERSSIWQKVVGSAVVFLGVILIYNS